jgi:uncharacterized phage-like protein YoqJ
MAILQTIEEALLEIKPSAVITGMALGVDQWAAEVCIHHEIPFAAFIPYPDHGSNWPPHAQAHYQWLLSKAYQTVVVNPNPGFDGRKMHARNEWIVQNCELLLAVYNGTPGGTQNCLGTAARLNREIRYLPIPAEAMPHRLTIPMPTAPRIVQQQVGLTPAQETQAVRPRITRIVEE